MAQGYRTRREQQQRDMAWMLANMLQPWAKETLKPEDFFTTPRQPTRQELADRLVEWERRRQDGQSR